MQIQDRTFTEIVITLFSNKEKNINIKTPNKLQMS